MKTPDSTLSDTCSKRSLRAICIPHIAWFVFFASLAFIIQCSIPYPFDDDTAYHFSVARLIRQHGLLQSFPWTPFSWQATHYADKELLFHLLFSALTGLEFITAARIVGVFAGTAILVAIYLVLNDENTRYPGIWTLIPLASSVFVFRFALVRPHLISIALATVMLWALANRRSYILGCCSFLFPLSYVAFWQIPLMLLVATESARVFGGEKIQWKQIAVVVTGITAGVLIHPNSWNLLQLNWIHMSDILFQGAWGDMAAVELGSEFYPYSWREWSRFLSISVGFIVIATYLSWKDRRRCSTPLAYAIAAIIFALLTVKSMRFLEYFVPLSMIALAVAVRSFQLRLLAPALLFVYVLYTLAFGTGPGMALFSSDVRVGHVLPETARMFVKSIPPNSQIFTCGWDYTGELLLVLPDRKYIVAADPTLFYLNDPIRYAQWGKITALDPAIMTRTIRETFNSRFVLCENNLNYERLFDSLSLDPTVSMLLVDNRWVLFDLGGVAAK